MRQIQDYFFEMKLQSGAQWRRKKKFIKKIKELLKERKRCRKIFEGEITVVIVFYLKQKNLYKFVDIDNLLKGTLDAFEGVFYQNDNQITKIIAEKKTSNHLEGFSIQIRG